MKSYLVRENSIWNKMFYGKCHQSIEERDGAEEHSFQDEKKPYFDDEKDSYDVEPIKEIYKSDKKKTNWTLWLLKAGVALLLIKYFILSDSRYSYNGHFNFGGDSNDAKVVESKNLIDSFDIASADSISALPPKQVIEVGYPNVKNPKFGAPVYSSLLVNHTFGNSWGKPAIETFTVPSNVTFNKVVLTLNTTVDGVQYDRLANIFVDGIQVWRTSTAEPGGREVFSTFDKDVSKYLSLFEDEFSVLFQLDNLITPRLTGAFHVELYATFYNTIKPEEDVESFASATPYGNSSKYSVLSRYGPASKVYGLSKQDSDESPSIHYLPSDKIQVNLPKVAYNTTRLTLSVFASGNSAEEFWYSNVLDSFVHKFEAYGKTLLGHGPVRIVNVYFNGEKIATQAPQPFIFTGGISPALWSPVVAISAFDLPSIDVDITGLLPYLWEKGAIEDRLLEIEISNGYDELPPKPDGTMLPNSGISENWITSANLLTYENDKVVKSEGVVSLINDTAKITTIAIAPPFSGMITQIITSKFSSILSSNLSFTLADGSSLRTSVTSFTKADTTNVQRYVKHGESQSLVHVGNSEKSTTFLDIDISAAQKKPKKDKHSLAPNVIQQVNTSHVYPLVAQLTEKDSTIGGGNVNIKYDVTLANAKETKLKVNGLKVMKEKVSQNGTSTYYITSEGNHGSGDLDTIYKFKTSSPFPEFKYKRNVTASNGEITSDLEEVGKEIECEAILGDLLTLRRDQLQYVSEHLGIDLSQLEEVEDRPMMTRMLNVFYEMEEPASCNMEPMYPIADKKFRKLF